MKNTDTPIREDVRRYAAAQAHAAAHAQKKRAAAVNGVTVRTERRWRTPTDSKGSPQHRYGLYLETAEEPWRLLACNRVTVIQQTIRRMTKAQIIERIHELHVEDARQEGVDNANRFRHLPWLKRADDTSRDAAHDLELAALYRECAARRVPESEVFGGLS